MQVGEIAEDGFYCACTGHIPIVRPARKPPLAIPPPLFLLLAFKLYPPSPLTNLFHPARVFIDPATRFGLSLANDSIGPSTMLLHHLKRLFAKRR